MVSTHTTRSGPLFDGRAAAAARDFADTASREIAELGANEVQALLGQVLQNPTGNYRGKVTTDRATDGYGVTDQDVIYGAWLEGTTSRNESTRFKGYQHFRKVTESLNRRAGTHAETLLRRFLPRMGG